MSALENKKIYKYIKIKNKPKTRKQKFQKSEDSLASQKRTCKHHLKDFLAIFMFSSVWITNIT